MSDFPTFEAFRSHPTEPTNLPNPLRALWRDAAGDWEAAHHLVQDERSAQGAWVHAYLHRKEGDLSNARYWYDRAAQPMATGKLDAEWETLVRTLLADQSAG